jgi:hypothetical protein
MPFSARISNRPFRRFASNEASQSKRQPALAGVYQSRRGLASTNYGKDDMDLELNQQLNTEDPEETSETADTAELPAAEEEESEGEN